jgi:hypothetical protein
MRCRSCDCNLTDAESVRKSPTTGEYLDLCNYCLEDIGMWDDMDNTDDLELEEDE